MGVAADTSGRLDAARAAFARADWESARDLFAEAVEADPSPEALDGHGQALWWLGETGAAIERRAKAFAAYRKRGDAERAAYLAVFLAAEYRIAGNSSLARGWLGRGERLLADLGDCNARGWLYVELCKRATDPLEEERHAVAALELARRLEDSDLEVAALSHVALARISLGDVDGGLALLDETMAAAVAGEAEDPLAIGEACCMTLVACEQLADAGRARDWSQAVVDFTRRRNYTPLKAWCRAIYARFLVATGRWDEAERELERSLDEYSRLRETSRVDALAALADLRIRQGRLEEAAQLLAGSEDRAPAVEPVVRLHIARDELDLAAERVEQRLEAVAERDAAVAPLLGLRAAVALARGDGEAARAAVAELVPLAERLGRADLGAIARVQAAQASRIAGDPPAPGELESAIEELARLELPLEEAQARLELARALADGRPGLALEQARAALAACERLGAARHADEAAKLLRDLGAPGRPAPRGRGALTRREGEVLALLGAGLSNAEIAARLVITPKTAEHHVGRVLRKLGLRNRAEAAAYAVRTASRDGGTL